MNRIITNRKAITLIALVITIVVLIILAAVAINLSLGNNGIFNRAKTAKEKYSNSQEYEQKELSSTNQLDQLVGNTRGITPSGTIDINSNGEYDITNYATANVNVEGYTILESGTFTTASTASGKHTYNTITFKNTYTEEQHAVMMVSSLVSAGKNVAPYMTMGLSNDYIVGNTKKFAVVNYGVNGGTMTFNYVVVSNNS